MQILHMSDSHEYEICALYFSLYIEMEYHLRKSLWGMKPIFCEQKKEKKAL